MVMHRASVKIIMMRYKLYIYLSRVAADPLGELQ